MVGASGSGASTLKILLKTVNTLSLVANRAICLHGGYVVDHDDPTWARCANCGKSKRWASAEQPNRYKGNHEDL